MTAREHFICHWLLVKRFNKGTNERRKMLYAFWIMKSNPDDNGKRYINSRAYETLRIEYSNLISNTMSANQKGDKNSSFGKHWFTNSDTGECKSFYKAPDEKWIMGRNIFRGECSNYPKNSKTKRILKNEEKAKMAWDEYNSGDFSSIRDYCRKTKKYSQPNLVYLFKKYIPISNTLLIGRSHNNKSNKELVGKYIQE